jgi:hypothetical protein
MMWSRSALGSTALVDIDGPSGRGGSPCVIGIVLMAAPNLWGK